MSFIITKSDLLPHLILILKEVKKDALSLNPDLKIFVISATTGRG